MISYNGHNGRGHTSVVREIVREKADPVLERHAGTLGVLLTDSVNYGVAESTIDKYRQMLESVWVPDKFEASDYYTRLESFAAAVSPVLGGSLGSRVISSFEKKALGRAKAKYQDKMVAGLNGIIEEYSCLISNCESKISETSGERDISYEKATTCESLALKEIEYADAFQDRLKKVKKDAKSLLEKGKRQKVCDCEKVIHDLQINTDASRRKARHYALQNEAHSKKAGDTVDRINYLRFLQGKYSAIVAQAKVMLEYIDSNDFNIESCLLPGDRIEECTGIMDEAESVVKKQEEAQESSLDFADEKFGFKDKYSGSESWRGTMDEYHRKDEKETAQQIRAMHERSKKRLEKLLAS